MAKKTTKEPQKQEKEEKPKLTEWQKRNLDFLKRKEEKKEQQDKLKKELVEEKRARLRGDKVAMSEETAPKKTAKSEKSKKLLARKKAKPKKKTGQKKPKSTKFKRRLMSVLIPAVLGILLALYFITPLSKIKKVEVQGAKQTTSQSVLKASKLSDNAYTISTIFNRSNLARSIEANDPWVKSAKVSYHFPFTFTVTVKEYSVVAYAQTDQGYEPILESGKRLDSVSTTDLPATFTTINLKNGKYLSQLIKKLTKMDKSLVSEIKVITLTDSKTTPDLLNLEMQDGNTVRVPLSEIDTKLPYYDKIKDKLKDNHIIDMEVGIYATNAQEDSTDTQDEQAESSEPSEASDDANNASADQDQAQATPEENNQEQPAQDDTTQASQDEQQ